MGWRHAGVMDEGGRGRKLREGGQDSVFERSSWGLSNGGNRFGAWESAPVWDEEVRNGAGGRA
jgi:hypothetical protein